MSVLTNVPNLISSPDKSELRHRMQVWLAAAASVALLLSVAIYGFDYYWLGAADRPYSPKHPILRPSGLVGVKLGILGVVLFLLIFLYPLRKKIPWLARKGTATHWLDFHVVLGMTAPVLIAFHASFKFHGIAGMAFWIMFLVAVSGFVGRYLYAQIPRSINAAELSLRELAAQQEELTNLLAGQDVLSATMLEPLFREPSPEEVKNMSALRAVLNMFMFDLALPFRIAQLRRCVLSPLGKITSFGGLFKTNNQSLENVVRVVRREASLSKRIAFLARTQQVLHLWHVIHRPFSYSFAVLAVLHIVVALGLGFM